MAFRGRVGANTTGRLGAGDLRDLRVDVRGAGLDVFADVVQVADRPEEVGVGVGIVLAAVVVAVGRAVNIEQ